MIKEIQFALSRNMGLLTKYKFYFSRSAFYKFGLLYFILSYFTNQKQIKKLCKISVNL